MERQEGTRDHPFIRLEGGDILCTRKIYHVSRMDVLNVRGKTARRPKIILGRVTTVLRCLHTHARRIMHGCVNIRLACFKATNITPDDGMGWDGLLNASLEGCYSSTCRPHYYTHRKAHTKVGFEE